jgi:THO complex subunit 3
MSHPSFARFSTLIAQHSKKEYQSKERLKRIEFNSEGRKVSSSSNEKQIKIYNIDGGSFDLRGHSHSVESTSWDPSHPERLVSTSTDRTVRFWDIRSKKSTGQHDIGIEGINVQYDRKGSLVAVVDASDTITLLEPRMNRIVQSIKNDIIVNQVAWNYANDVMFVTTGSGSIQCWQEKCEYEMVGHTSSCTCISFDPIGRYVATGGQDATTTVWDLDSLLPLYTLSQSYRLLNIDIQSRVFLVVLMVSWLPLGLKKG